MQVSEVASAAARDQDLFAHPVGMVKHNNPAAAAARVDGAEQACCAGAHNHHIVVRSGNLHSMARSSSDPRPSTDAGALGRHGAFGSRHVCGQAAAVWPAPISGDEPWAALQG